MSELWPFEALVVRTPRLELRWPSPADLYALAEELQDATSVLFLGRHAGFPIALEGALKLKEISYIHAEGYAAGEMKHGPIALIDRDMPVVVVAPRDSQYEKTFSNMEEVRAREGQIVAIATEGDEEVERVATHVVHVPKMSETALPIATVVPLQLMTSLISTFIQKQKGVNQRLQMVTI